jgi:hypothetical protein
MFNWRIVKTRIIIEWMMKSNNNLNVNYSLVQLYNQVFSDQNSKKL